MTMAADKQDKVLNVPTLRFPEFTDEWELHPTTDFFEFKNGLNPDSKRFGSGTKFISVMDILNNRYITYDKIKAFVEPKGNDLNEFGVNYGDVLFQRSSETLEDVGRANVYLDKKTALFGGFVIRGKKIGEYNPLFFRYLLSSPHARKRIVVKGAGAQHFNIGQDGLSKISIFVPTTKEQERIAKLLDLIDERIETQNRIIEDLKQLRSALYYQIFSNIQGNWVTLKMVGDITKGKQINGSELSDEGMYYVMNGGITPSGYYNNYNTPANTISISEGGNSCGYVQYNSVPFWSGGHCYNLRIKKGFDLQYIFHFLKFKELDIMALRIGSGLPNIQKKDLEHFHVHVPDFTTQKKVSGLFVLINKKEETEIKLMNAWRKQKKYLLQKLFI